MTKTIIRIIVFVLVQVLVLKGLAFWSVAFCFIYILCIVSLPIELNRIALMLIALGIGFTTDLFYETLGIHSFASVLTAYLRPFWLSTLTPSGGYDVGQKISISSLGLSWFTLFCFPLIVVHILVLFLLESSDFSYLGGQLWKALCSSLFTFSAFILSEYLIPRSK